MNVLTTIVYGNSAPGPHFTISCIMIHKSFILKIQKGWLGTDPDRQNDNYVFLKDNNPDLASLGINYMFRPGVSLFTQSLTMSKMGEGNIL